MREGIDRLNKLIRVARDERASGLVLKGSEEPFMVLSFLALLVIPELKLTDRGLVDVTLFQHVPLFAGETGADLRGPGAIGNRHAP